MVSVIIPLFNKRETLAACLEAVLNNNYPQKEVVVVDDASTDGSRQIAREYVKRGITLIELAQHQGVSYACNAALKKAKGEIIIRTDADTVVTPDWIRQLVKYFRQPEVVAVSGSYSCLNENSLVASCTSLIDAVFSDILKRRFLLTCARGANSAFRADALGKIKGFDQSCSGSEDIKVFLDIKKLGKVVYDPQITVKTHYPDSIKRLWMRHYQWGYAVGRNRVYLRNPKSYLRLIFMGGFFAATASLMAGGYFLPLGVYLTFFLIAMIMGLRLTRRMKRVFLLPFIFLLQNTAYCLGQLKGLLFR